MLRNAAPLIRPFNNDRMAYLTAFRAPVQEARAASAAQVLESAPPRPAALDDGQAESALAVVRQEVSQGAVGQAHTALDADRVARLLGLLE